MDSEKEIFQENDQELKEYEEQQELIKVKKLLELAQKVIRLTQNTLTVNMRFLSSSINFLKFKVSDMFDYATDGQTIFYDPLKLLSAYQKNDKTITRNFLHMIFHCLFHHNFIFHKIDSTLWSIAADIAVESSIEDLDLGFIEKLNPQQLKVIKFFKKELKVLTVEKIYHYLLTNKLDEKTLNEYHSLFFVDNHMIWFIEPKPQDSQEEQDNNSDDGSGGEDRDDKSQGNSSKNQDQNQNSQQNKESQSDPQNQNQNQQQSQQNSNSSQQQNRQRQKELLENWKDISQKVQTELETFSKRFANEKGDFFENIRLANKPKYNYEEFLKKFTIHHENMKINEDEFDYIFYTYGLKLYKNVPLIEPLEYKEEKSIKEFVIAIDTSGSVQGELVKKFLEKTYSILSSQQTFTNRFNIHIIQCDADIQQDVKITNKEEFERYINGDIKLFGFGGTDFRPMFEYVKKLEDQKEFNNLQGLIYFTDGYGVYPKYPPKYKTAFVFLESIDSYLDSLGFPSWAMKINLFDYEIKNFK